MSSTVTSTVKPHSGPSGFWSHAMSPLITWPPSSALRLLQIRNFVFWSRCDLAATNPTLHAWPKVTFQLSNIQQYFCSLGFAKGSKATWEKLLVHPAGSRTFDLLPKFWKFFFLNFTKALELTYVQFTMFKVILWVVPFFIGRRECNDDCTGSGKLTVPQIQIPPQNVLDCKTF